ncbi:MAG: nitrous oxide reductase accessory protein NosL [Bacteroidota bacterium]|nr:nitrous oxide reductase accessory protein NosL [Bacteroidota bacterium]
MARWIVGVASIAMVFVLFLPIWRIELSAPQYPEGLVLQIYADKIGGDVDIVNGLNHYIGMRTLHTRDFVEFIALPYIIGGLLAIGLLVALLNKRKLLYGFVLLFLATAFISMVDFYRWEYNYGHNLDESAPIKVPGMAYQPPLIGYKQLLNFSAYSVPDKGGWIFAGVGALLALAAFLEIRKHRKNKARISPTPSSTPVIVAMLLVSTAIMSCSTGPNPIRYGQDDCDYCKMGISDRRFGFEILTQKGKAYKFDDMHCLLSFIQSNRVAKSEIAEFYFADFSGNGKWIRAADSYLLQSPALHSPMNGNVAAFASPDSLTKYRNELQGQQVLWKDLYK